MTRGVLTSLLILSVGGAAWAQLNVDRASVRVENRNGKDWCVIDAQVSGLVDVPLEALTAAVQDYNSYPAWFRQLREVGWEQRDDAVLLSETVVVSALGIRNVNRFTLRLTASPSPDSFRLDWTQDHTDGTIDGIEGGWTFEAQGAPEQPETRVTYRTKSAVSMVAFGQDLLMQVFLGKETKDVVEAVVRAARALTRARF